MSEIFLKIPKKKKKISIINNTDIINSIIGKTEEIIPDVLYEEEFESKLVEVKSHFTHKFVLKSSSKPIQIYLDKLPKPSLPIEDVKIEIQAAYDKGFEDGKESSMIIYENEITNYKNRILSIENVIENLKQNYLSEINKFFNSLVDISTQVAGYIIDKEIEIDNSIILKTVKKAFDEIKDDKIFQIIVNPYDYETLKIAKSQIFTNESIAKNIELLSDNKIKRGGAVLVTDAGTLDMRIETQLNKIKSILEENISIEQEIALQNNLLDKTELNKLE